MGSIPLPTPLAQTALFTPLRLGPLTLQHRIALAPLTRNRAEEDHTPSKLAKLYYTQRASVPGTLLITEGTFIAAEAGGMRCVPGVWNEKQVEAWREITDAVHAKGSYIYCQLWALGRAASADILHQEGGYDVISASDVPLSNGGATPRPLTKDEVGRWVGLYAQAARNARRAGFDGVEIHGANGYLVDQFLQDVTNKRTDEYGGSIENRCRFALEVVKAVADAVGEDRTGIRLSPWSQFNDMRMPNPIPTFSALVTSLARAHPSLAYIHITEPRVMGNLDRPAGEGESNDFLREIWKGSASGDGGRETERVFLTAGGYGPGVDGGEVPRMGDVVVFGRWFISNPDLPLRLKNGLPLTKYNRATFYLVGPDKAEGYTDYPTAEEQEKEKEGKL